MPASSKPPQKLPPLQRRIQNKLIVTLQSFHLLRPTAGACKIEYLFQTLTRSGLTEQLVATCSGDLRQAYAALLPEGSVEQFPCTHATRVGRAATFWSGPFRKARITGQAL